MATIQKTPAMKLVKPKTGAGPVEVAATAAAPAAEEAVEQTTSAAVVKKVAAGKAAGKTVAKTAAKTPVAAAAEVAADGEDLIASTAAELEALESANAFTLVPELINNIDHDYFKLGGVLAKIQAEGWFQDSGFDNFRAYVEASTGLQYRKAMYLIQIYTSLVSCGVTWAQVAHLGWTKLKDLAPILDPSNAADWIALAAGITVLELQEYIKNATKGENAGNSAEGAGAADTTKVTTMTFKLHEDQKATVREALDKAKHETGTEHDTVALEHIAIDFLGGESKLKGTATLSGVMATASIEEVLEQIGALFPTIVIQAEAFETVEEAQARTAELEAEAEASAGEPEA